MPVFSFMDLLNTSHMPSGFKEEGYFAASIPSPIMPTV